MNTYSEYFKYTLSDLFASIPLTFCYEQIDGRYAGQTDAKGLSLGLAQWNDRGKVDVSAKVWRYTGEKWSRQSEELPLHHEDIKLFASRDAPVEI